MARKPRLHAPGILHHVIVRGNQRQKTFLSPDDYQYYLQKLAQYRRKFDVTLFAYCLMPNHVHLLLECVQTPLGKFMQGVQQSYTQYFNRKYQKSGHLFQGRYQAILCQKESYLLELVRYVHLNPVRSKLAKAPQDYAYSGDRAYRMGKATLIVDPRLVLKTLGGVGEYKKFIRDGLQNGHMEEYYEVSDQRFLGEEEFGEDLKRDYEKDAGSRKKPAIEEVVRELARELGITTRELKGPSRGWKLSRQRTEIMYVLVRRAGYGVSEVARYVNRDANTISSTLSRYEGQLETQPELCREIEGLARIV